MEKLVKLLKEYAPDYCKDYPDDIIMDEIVISKRFGFIKWLVDNDKIDLDNEDLCSLMSELGEWGQYEKCLLMLLAISDTPIDFLCEIIKK